MRVILSLGFVLSVSTLVNAAARAADVYRCTQEGVTTVTDHPPDGDNCQLVALHINSMGAPAAASTNRSRASAGRNESVVASGSRNSQTSIAQEQAKLKQACDKLATQLRDIAAQMRSGYSIPQGERLQQRKDQLEQQRRAQRC